MAGYPTAHINARPEDFAETVLMPGDPLRSRYIAENYLESPVLINDVRGVQGYTGTYKGKRVSVMASGMGMPSMGIYSYELFNFFGVKNIIRVGTTGSIQPDVHVRDIIIAQAASTDSAYASHYGIKGSYSAVANFELLCAAVEAAKQHNADYHVGSVLTTDLFYTEDPNENENWRKFGILAVEMETAALYINAARAGRRAVSIYTVSDHILTGEKTTAEERQTSFSQMMEIALDTAISL